MNIKLMKVNWPLMDDMIVEEAWSFFSEQFGATMNAHIPKTIPTKDCQKKLKFKKHVSHAVNKASRILGIIRTTFYYLDEDTVLQL